MKRNNILVIMLIICSCIVISCVDFGKPKYNDEIEITTEFGDTFRIARVEHDFPDQEISIGVTKQG